MNARYRRPLRVRDAPDHREPSLYLESSALVAAVLESDASAMTAIRQSRTVASALTFAESRRAVIRAAASGWITQGQAVESADELTRIESGCAVLEISDTVLARVGRRFPVEPVCTLDAIHLATAEVLDDPAEPVTVLTRDHRIRENAERMGLRVAGRTDHCR